MTSHDVVLSRLKEEPDSALLSRTKDWLHGSSVEAIAVEPARITVEEASRVWGARLRSSERNGVQLDGAEGLLTTLRDLNPTKKVEQYGFEGDGRTGAFFFEKANGRFVGMVVVEQMAEGR